MQLADLARVLAIEDNLEVGLVPGCHGGHSRPRKLGQRMEVQTIQREGGQIGGGQGQCERDRGREAHEVHLEVLRAQVHGSQVAVGPGRAGEERVLSNSGPEGLALKKEMASATGIGRAGGALPAHPRWLAGGNSLSLAVPGCPWRSLARAEAGSRLAMLAPPGLGLRARGVPPMAASK